MKRRATPLRPEGAPRLGETYRDWRDFTDRVARPWVYNDGDDARVDNWYRTLMMERDPWYLAVALVMADNRIKALEAELGRDWAMTESTAGGCPRGTEHCGYARGERYCSLWDTCQDLAEMSRQLTALKQAQADEGG